MKQRKNHKKVIILATVLAVGALSAVAYAATRHSDPPKPSRPTSTINYGPPTSTEKAETEAHKDDLAKQSTTPTSPTPTSDGKKTVSPVITNASQSGNQINVNGYVSGVVEEDQTCEVVFTKGSLQVRKTSKGFANVSVTNCTPFAIDRNDFTEAGDWSLILSYSSSKAAGASAPKTVTIK